MGMHFTLSNQWTTCTTQYVQPFIVSTINHCCALYLETDFYQRMDFKWILGAPRKVDVKESQAEKKEEMKKKDWCWRRCTKSLC